MKVSKITIIALAFIAIVFIFSVVRAANQDRWSGWAFGDAQALNAADHFVAEGPMHSFFIPDYSLQTDFFLQHGIYTHYPQLLDIPLWAAVIKAGFDPKLGNQCLAILFSALALALLYLAVRRLVNEPVALLALIFTGLSVVFLDFIDSLENQPFDEMFRFGFILLVVLAASARRRKLYLAGAWLLAFGESLVSFEYILFLELFLILWDLIIRRKVSFGVWVLFGLAPVIGLLLHLAQNSGALGFQRAINDLWFMFGIRQSGSLPSFLETFHDFDLGFRTAFGFRIPAISVVILISILLLWKAGLKHGSKYPAGKVILALFIPSIAYWLLLPSMTRSMIIYMPRHIIAPLALALASLTYYLFPGNSRYPVLSFWKNSGIFRSGKDNRPALKIAGQATFASSVLLMVGILLLGAIAGYSHSLPLKLPQNYLKDSLFSDWTRDSGVPVPVAWSYQTDGQGSNIWPGVGERRNAGDSPVVTLSPATGKFSRLEQSIPFSPELSGRTATFGIWLRLIARVPGELARAQLFIEEYPGTASEDGPQRVEIMMPRGVGEWQYVSVTRKLAAEFDHITVGINVVRDLVAAEPDAASAPTAMIAATAPVLFDSTGVTTFPVAYQSLVVDWLAVILWCLALLGLAIGLLLWLQPMKVNAFLSPPGHPIVKAAGAIAFLALAIFIWMPLLFNTGIYLSKYPNPSSAIPFHPDRMPFFVGPDDYGHDIRLIHEMKNEVISATGSPNFVLLEVKKLSAYISAYPGGLGVSPLIERLGGVPIKSWYSVQEAVSYWRDGAQSLLQKPAVAVLYADGKEIQAALDDVALSPRDRIALMSAREVSLADGVTARILASPPPVVSVKEVDMSKLQKAFLTAESISVSSFNQAAEDASKLTDGDAETYWHVKYPRRPEPEWVTVSFAEPAQVMVVKIRPRWHYVNQLWNADSAALQSSNDGTDWRTIAYLSIDRQNVDNELSPWLSFPVGRAPDSVDKARYWRIFIEDQSFLSISELEVYTPGPARGALPEGFASLDMSWVSVSVSSQLNAQLKKENLVDGDPATFWQARFPKEMPPDWIIFDFGEQQYVNALRLMPQRGKADQMWNGNHAVLQGSPDGQAWKDLSYLTINRAALMNTGQGWIVFTFENKQSYRFYRIVVYDINFLSLAEVEFLLHTPIRGLNAQAMAIIDAELPMYRRLNVDSASVAVSSSNQPYEAKENLVDGNPGTYWHVRYPKPPAGDEWITIDPGNETSVRAIRVMPRAGYISQIWDGLNAVFQGSHDKITYQDLSRLQVQKSLIPNEGYHWLAFELSNNSDYRYYRLLIHDESFLSLAELEFYVSR